MFHHIHIKYTVWFLADSIQNKFINNHQEFESYINNPNLTHLLYLYVPT